MRGRRVRTAMVLGAAAVLMSVIAVRAAAPGSEADRMSTGERIAQPGWWPTKLLATRKDFVGSEACAPCHASVVASAKDSEMAKALLRPEDATVLRSHTGQSFQVDSYHYKLEQTPQGFTFTVGQGPTDTTQPITWAFGDGSLSQVYMTNDHGTWVESHFSYFGGTKTFDRTTNQPRQASSIGTAVGRTLPPMEIRKCFACHAAGVTADGGFSDVIPGVACEACHGPGADHVAAMKSHVEGGEGLIMNPKRLDRTASVDFCGACHMTWVDVQLDEATGASTVRFPAYRLENSKCWSKGDARITCVGCHDPHQPLVRTSAHYDEKCLGCHLTTPGTTPTKDHPGKACPQADHNCASCHMPKQDFADTHHSFTDHDIRIVRAGEPVPD
jgi:hypothetical protein